MRDGVLLREALANAAPREQPRALAEPLDAGGAGLAVSLDRVGKRFDAREVLRDVSLEIAAGTFVAVVGHSGCGKSTLLRLIAGLSPPSAGVVAVGGAATRGAVPAIRLMFQDARLLPWRRVLDNVGIGRTGAWRSAARAALGEVGLADRADAWPSALSGGQRQRVALARALVSRPRLLLLDEPLGALDALTRLEMQILIEEVWRAQRFTAILVTHDVAEAVALADRVVVLEAGRIAAVHDIVRDRPRPRGDAELAEIEGRILARLLRRG
jgi:sulfonate transport system ATP-binding protein